MAAAKNSSSPPVTLWLKSEPFTIGSLQAPPHSRLTVTNIKKIVAYAKTKGKSGFPYLSYSVWKHIACTKLGLSEDIAWTYFVTFELVNAVTVDQLVEFEKKAAADETRSQLSLPTLRFVLFIYVQHIQKISLRASLVSGSDEWPTRARSPDLEGRSNSAIGKALDENEQLTFVLSNLDIILDLLTETDSRGTAADNSRDTKDLSLTMEAVEALEYLITGSLYANKSIRSLREIASLPALHQETGYSKSTRCFSFRSLQTWLRSHLSQNPFGVLCTLSKGHYLSWSMFGESREQGSERRRRHIITNGDLIPKDQARWNKLIVISQVSQQTVARSSATLKGATVKIHRCYNAFIYLLCPLRAVSIEKCKHTTVVVGAVELSLDVVRCEETVVIGVARRLTTIGSKSCRLHVMTPNRPLVYCGNEEIIFGPYHTYYPQLEAHMDHVGLRPKPNLWDQPQHVGADHPDDGAWVLLKPKDFYRFVIPFEMEGDTKDIPGGLQDPYQKALAQRYRSVDAWKEYVRNAGLTKEQKRTFERVIEERFQEWLDASGHLQQLDGLSTSVVS
jgi:TBCC domain-containing protein 1